MRRILNGFKVSSKSYYFLLDWNDQNNKQYIADKFGKQKLCNLTKEEYRDLWLYATMVEYKNII